METVTAIGGAVLSAFFQGLLDRFTSLDLIKYAQEGQFLAELKKWEKKLKKLYVVLDDAEEKQWVNPLVKMWVSDLRDLAYDLEDVLDELATEAQRRELQAETQARPSKVRRIISIVSASMNLSTFKFNAEMISKIEGISARLDEIIKEKDDLNLGEFLRGRSSQVRARLPSTSLVNEANIYGREKDKREILELLKNEVSDVKVSVIPIVGMGGIGKTTLAQLIFNDDSLEFDFKAWVSVGEDFDVVRMTKTILQLESCGNNDLNSLQMQLKEKLSMKKFLIVLDDVWTESYEDWTLFFGPFEAGASGSKVIVTTRNGSVSSMMGTTRAYSLNELSHNDCMSVFAQHALGETNFDEHLDLKEIGKEIVRRCQGLPLAAKALGGMLRGSPNLDLWEEVLNNNIWDLPDEKINILPALMLSYFHLPSHLKQCFTYCAIFPKDYEFDKDELIWLWMAEGFLYQPKKIKQMRDLGCKYFDDLLSRSFFQHSSSNRSRYVMHDLMNDLARYVSREICYQLGDELEDVKSCTKILYSSFTRHIYDISQRFEVFYVMKGLRTLLALPILSKCCSYYLSRKVLHDLVPKLKCLRVLSLASYQFADLPNSIGALKHLRYLNLSYSGIVRLPESVGELFNLQTLILRGCKKLVELPMSIGNLINLQCLDIRDTDNLQKLPLEIGNLKNIQQLSKVIVGEGNGLEITVLKKLSHLRGQLRITGLQNVVDVRDADSINLKEKRRLDELELEWADDSNGRRNPINELQVLNSLQPHQNLSNLSILSYGGMEFPSWIGHPTFTNMIQLKFWYCQNVTSLPSLGLLPSLRKLSIGGMDRVKEVDLQFYGNGSSSVAFACLESLEFLSMLEWEQWSLPNGLEEEAAIQFPNLRELTIKGCPNLVGKLPSTLPSLALLRIQNCSQLVDLPKLLPCLHELHVSECQESVLKNVSDITTLSSLKLTRISGLVSLHEVLTQPLVGLKSLEIAYCDELMYLWQDGTNLDKLASLKHLMVYECEHLLTLVEGKEGLLPCNLEYLGVHFCKNLETLPNGLYKLTSLSDLTIYGCPRLVSFPATGLPYCLRYLEIQDCNSLVSLPEGVLLTNSNEMPHLEILQIEGCPSLEFFSAGKFPSLLKTLSICGRTENLLESLYCLSYITVLTLSDCPMLDSFPEKSLMIPSLISLTISRCDNLRSLPSQMQDLISLQNIEIEDCRRLVSFPEGDLPPNLTTLKIRNCKRLGKPMPEWGLDRLSSLKRLEIEGTSPSTDMVSFPDDDGLLLPTSVTYIFIIGLKNLKSISKGLLKLTSLKDLLIVSCPKLQTLPKEGFPCTLGLLVIESCPLLKDQLATETGKYWPNIAPIPYFKMDYIGIRE